MKVDEPYDPNIKSKSAPNNLEFVVATEVHFDSIVQMMSERNPNLLVESIRNKTKNELSLNENDSSYWLYVAVLDSKVIGLCRFFHSEGMPSHKKIFPSPVGWYGMGILVDKSWRRCSVAKFLSLKRIEVLRGLGAKSMYSIVDSENLTSRKMHENFGFQKIEQAHGFLHLDFKEKIAFLYRVEF